MNITKKQKKEVNDEKEKDKEIDISICSLDDEIVEGAALQEPKDGIIDTMDWFTLTKWAMSMWEIH